MNGFDIDGGQPKGFLRPCLALLVREAPAHGYDLMEKLREFGFDRDPGGLYRSLRSLEHEGLVVSDWERSMFGPDRRRYRITEKGERYLDAWAPALEETARLLDAYLQRYRQVTVGASARETT